jgi:hypothetical protein
MDPTIGGRLVKPVECCREQDVLDALVSGRWPDDLQSHASACAVCSDLVAAVRPILADRGDLSGEGHIPSSGVMWWRAQMRARQEAAREASRPITIAQIVASISAVALIIAAVVVLSPWFGVVLGNWIAEAKAALTPTPTVVAAPATTLVQVWMIPAIIIGVSLLLAPVAIYFAVADD